jgi:drug/metabolite transporter (DMT)-like permease
METKKKETLNSSWPALLIILQWLFYGFGDPISKVAYEVTPVYTLLTLRYSIAFIVLFIFFGKRIIKTVRTVPLRTWLIPGLCIGLAYLVGNVALSLSAATSIAFIRSLSVVLTPALAFIFYRARFRWQHIALQILAVLGLYLLCVQGGLSGFGLGEALELCDAILRAAALVFSMRSLDSVDPVSLTALQAGCSSVLAIIACFVFEGGIHTETVTPQAWAIILYLAITCTLLGYLLQNFALTRISDRSVALLQSTAPVMTAIFAFFILGEKLSPAGIAGSAIILICVIVSTLIPAETR